MRLLSPLERTAHLGSATAGEVKYESRRTWTREEAEVAVSKVNWWYPSECWKNLKLPAEMVECDVCCHVNPPHYGSRDLDRDLHICEDCRAKAHTLHLEALKWFENSHFYLDWFQRGARWYALRPLHFRDVNRLEDNDVGDRHENHPEVPNTFYQVAADLRGYDGVLDETNLSEEYEDLDAEIRHYEATGRILKPKKMPTDEAQDKRGA